MIFLSPFNKVLSTFAAVFIEQEDIFCEGIVLLRLERPIKTAGINYVIPSPFIRENFSDYYSFALVAFLSPEIVFVPCARICLRLRRLFSVLFLCAGILLPERRPDETGRAASA